MKNPVSIWNGVQLSRVITEAPKASEGERGGRNRLKVSGWLCIMLMRCLRATRKVWQSGIWGSVVLQGCSSFSSGTLVRGHIRVNDLLVARS